MIKVPTPKMRWWEKIYLFEIVRGLCVTMGHLIRNIFVQKNIYTHQWPEEPKPLFPRLKARHRLTRRDDGTPKCTACYCCQTVCPAYCIHIVAEESPDGFVEKRPKQFEIDILRCVFCGYCVEACPEDAIRMDTGDAVIVSNHREDFILDLKFLLNGKGTEWRRSRRFEDHTIARPPATFGE
ncbi:MAG: NADH-quinone oxidoreductase subunit I [Candidatus Eisenbacteria bacterium]|uniref:NADH-quinone oxidoreductase subunit I n=1 Tax=Eiseniibacteriota bacterium TaxID=2212470 RepID=A0A948W835_UNCEI|nr:NADH-quinone oxidoreductase subunit I [Candidatus Eisenbacteria bacterium]MBU1950294.1 NADH-quinone oxidoreductase subunit I [Candidatus Eisenbacteria bacterium]MBU2692890.1 NADH-quinone oxidoreductase subunit I [Candidatus Eisenbacteria bacterium]